MKEWRNGTVEGRVIEERSGVEYLRVEDEQMIG